VGGFQASGSLGPTQIYDPTTDQWTFWASPPNIVEGATAGATTGKTAEKAIYVFGGGNENGNPTVLNQIYNPKNNNWYSGTNVPDTENSQATAVVLDDTIYIIGGLFSQDAPTDFPFVESTGNTSLPYFAINYQYIPLTQIESDSNTVTPSSQHSISDNAIILAILIPIICLALLLIAKRLKSK
jgi:N-acetylneuraminic acid mutarotase